MQRIKVGLHRDIEISGRNLGHIFPVLLMTGIDDQDVETAKGIHDPRGHGGVPTLVPNVARQGQGLHSGFLDQGDHLLGVRLL